LGGSRPISRPPAAVASARCAIRNVVLTGLDDERADLEVQPRRALVGRLVHRRQRRDVLGVRRDCRSGVLDCLGDALGVPDDPQAPATSNTANDQTTSEGVQS